MKKIALALAGALLVSGAVITSANAWERSGTVTGPRGNTFKTQGSVKANSQGGYDYNRSVTGPAGNTFTNSGSVKRNEDGSYTRSGQRTNPLGGGVTYGGTGKCSGGTCNYSGSRTRY